MATILTPLLHIPFHRCSTGDLLLLTLLSLSKLLTWFSNVTLALSFQPLFIPNYLSKPFFILKVTFSFYFSQKYVVMPSIL